jgi:hypothetical protein
MANKKEWKEKIIKACEEAGTYQEYFEDVINTLSQIMETRDSAQEFFEEQGSKPVVEYTNKAGHSSTKKNPVLVVINEQNQQALAYWRDLGLTPRGFKQLNGDAVQKKETTFEDVLSKLEI